MKDMKLGFRIEDVNTITEHKKQTTNIGAMSLGLGEIQEAYIAGFINFGVEVNYFSIQAGCHKVLIRIWKRIAGDFENSHARGDI